MAFLGIALSRSRRVCLTLCAVFAFAIALPAQDAQPPATPDAQADASQPAAEDSITTPAPPPCVPAKHQKCPKEKKEKKDKKNSKKDEKKNDKSYRSEPANISRGIFTVDGMIGKAALNYTIPNMRFIYFYAPGIGAVVISENKFSGAVEQKDVFDGHTITVTVDGGHVMQLYSDDIILSGHNIIGKIGKLSKMSKASKQDSKGQSAFVAYNASFTLPTKSPIVGYGDKPDAPYTWPGSKLNGIAKGIDADAPPVPTTLSPKLAANPCPAGQVLLNPPPPPPKDGSPAPPIPKGTPPPKCVLPKDVPQPPNKYVPLDQRPRS